LFHKVSEPLVVGCYEEPSLSGHRALLSGDSADPTAVCASLWRPGGEFNPGGAPSQPSLVGCVLDTGAVAVFPAQGSDVCADLGLSPYAGENARGDDAAIVELQENVSERFLSSCVGQEQAIHIAEQAVVASGLHGWRVAHSTAFTPTQPCASAYVDVANKTITLIPVANIATP
jgi:hypothetical protein